MIHPKASKPKLLVDYFTGGVMFKICHSKKSVLHHAVLAALIPLALAGCGGGGGFIPLGSGGSVVSGSVIKGPVSGATLTVYVLNQDGTYGAVLGTGTTDASGNFSFSLTTAHTGPAALVATGGTYTSETTGTTVSGAGSSLCAMAIDLSRGATGLIISPLSDMVCARAKVLAVGGTALPTAIADADTFVMGIYGLTGRPEGLRPSFTAGALCTDAGKLAMVLAALDKLRTGLAGGSDALYSALSSDIADGTFDGLGGGAAVPLGGGTLPFTAGSTDFVGALTSVAPAVFAGATGADILTGGVCATTGLGAVSPASVGLEATSSGAMSTLAVGGKQFLFVAARSKGVEKVDITNPAAPIVLGAADGWAGNTTGAGSLVTKFAGAIGGAQIIAGLPGGPQLLVFSYGAKHIALVNPDTGTVTWEGNLTLTNPLVGFSGGSAFIAGAIPVLGQGAWLATSDGYQLFDAAATLAAGPASPPVISTSYPIDPGQKLAENLGGDIAHGLIFAPNYGSGGAVQVINLAAKPGFPVGSYTGDPAYIPPASVTATGIRDGGAVDSRLQVGIMTYEDTPYATFVDMKNVVPGSTAKTFAPAATNGMAQVTFATTYLAFSGSAVDSSTHQALFMAGYSNNLAVGQLQDPASVPAGGTWNGLSDWVYYTIVGFPYTYATDPHAVAVVNIGGKSYGYLLNGSFSPTGVVQIDMSALLAMPRAGATGNAAHQAASSPTAAGGPIINIALP